MNTSEWRPVETAPKGELILMLSAHGGMLIGRWGDYSIFNAPKFTHWMPLPEPPRAADAVDPQGGETPA